MSKFSEMFSFKKDPSKDFEENIKDNQSQFNELSQNDRDAVIVRDKTDAERIEKTRNEKYDRMSEYKNDPESPESKEKIRESQELAQKFFEEFKDKINLDDENLESIVNDAYEKAEQLGMMKKAQEMREYFFGKEMRFYGVVYTCDQCHNNCSYCPFAALKREADARKKEKERILLERETNPAYMPEYDADSVEPDYPYRRLSAKQVVQETLAVMEQGHTHICYLEGSPNERQIQNGSYAKKISKFVTEIITATRDKGLKEIVLNIEPLTEEGFALIAEAGRIANEECGTNVSLQFRVFQETYNKDVYEKMHDQDPNMPKRDFQRRLDSQARALKAGFDNVGLGVLFNLDSHPLKEVQGLVDHANKLRSDSGRSPVRICLPSANELANFKVDIGHRLKTGEERLENGELGKFELGTYEKLNILFYVLLRLKDPTANIVSSERDTPEMLRILNRYATCTTLGVKTHTGQNSNIPLEDMVASKTALKKHQDWKNKKEDAEGEKVIGQATTFPRETEETLRSMLDDGWEPVLEGKTNLIEAMKIEKVRENIQQEK